MNSNVGAQSQPKPSPELGTAWILLQAFQRIQDQHEKF